MRRPGGEKIDKRTEKTVKTVKIDKRTVKTVKRLNNTK